MKMEALIDPTLISSCKLEPPDEDVKLSLDYSTHSSTTDAISEDGVTVKTELPDNTFDDSSSTVILENLLKTEMLSKTYYLFSSANMKPEEKVKVENVSNPDSQCTGVNVSVKLEYEDIKVENVSKPHPQCTNNVDVNPDNARQDENRSKLLPVITLSQQPCHVDGGDQRNEMDCKRSVPSSGSESKVMDGGVENGQGKRVDGDCETTLEGVHEENLIEIDVDESPDNCLVSGDTDKDTCDAMLDNLSTPQNSSDNGCGLKEDVKMCGEKTIVHKPLILSQICHLQSHIRTHAREKPHKCLTCEKTFSHRSSLQRHIRTHTGEKLHKCQTCEKTFPRMDRLQSHISTHTGEKLHKCLFCEKTFSRKDSLHSHISTHTGEKLHKCLTCENTFSQKTNLEYHIRTHTGERPYKCLSCGVAFSKKVNLQTHIRTHTGEKPYECLTCGMAFSHKSSLQTHIRTHTGEKPYKCLTCGMAFSHKSSLKTHMRTINTGKKPHAMQHTFDKFTGSTDNDRIPKFCPSLS